MNHACPSDNILFANLDGRDSVSPIVACSKACTYASKDCTTENINRRRPRSKIVEVVYVSIKVSLIVEGKQTLHAGKTKVHLSFANTAQFVAERQPFYIDGYSKHKQDPKCTIDDKRFSLNSYSIG